LVKLIAECLRILHCQTLAAFRTSSWRRWRWLDVAIHRVLILVVAANYLLASTKLIAELFCLLCCGANTALGAGNRWRLCWWLRVAVFGSLKLVIAAHYLLAFT